MEKIILSAKEAARLARLMSRPLKLTPRLRKSLARLADPNRKPPVLRWRKAKRSKRS